MGSILVQLIFKRFSHLTDQLTLKSITSSSCYILLYWLNLIYELGDWLQANSTLKVTVAVTVRNISAFADTKIGTLCVHVSAKPRAKEVKAISMSCIENKKHSNNI